DSRHVLLEFFLAFAANEALARLDRKYDMNVDLRVGIGHARQFVLAVGRDANRIVGTDTGNRRGKGKKGGRAVRSRDMPLLRGVGADARQVPGWRPERPTAPEQCTLLP